jgi:hypothetical protein
MMKLNEMKVRSPLSMVASARRSFFENIFGPCRELGRVAEPVDEVLMTR